MMKMKLDVFVVKRVSTNCYLVGNEVLKEMFVVDPGGASDQLVGRIKESGFTL